MSIAKFSVKNPILVNMLMIIVFIVGTWTLYNMPKEEMPAIDFGLFVIRVTYRGVSPEEMEVNVVNKIEEEIQDVDDIDYIQSTCQEGMALVYVFMNAGIDLKEAKDNIKNELDKVTDLPDDADDPVISEIKMSEVNAICSVIVSGDKDANTLREISEDLEDDLLNINYVSKTELSGTREREVWIEIDNELMNRYNLSYSQVANIVRATNKNTPGGNLDIGTSQYLVRTMGEYEKLDEIRNQLIRMNSDGSSIRIKDFATVTDTLQERKTISKFDGSQCATIEVYMKNDGNIINVVQEIKDLAKGYQDKIPGIRTAVKNDGSIRVENSINTLGTNAVMGIILVFVVLFIFIGWKNALFAAWGIPFSFLLTMIIMNYFGVTLNNLSLFGLILVIGMIVDDAIIVLENIHRLKEMGYSTYDAAIKGVSEILWPVVSAVATTISAFLPLAFMEGRMSDFLGNFTKVVTIALTASLIECLLLLPSHVVEYGAGKIDRNKENKIHKWLTTHYKKFITWVLCHRAISILILVLWFIGSGFLLVTGAVRFEFFPRSTPKTIVLKIDCETGSNLDQTNLIITELEKSIMNVNEKDDLESIVTTIGSYEENHVIEFATNYATIKIDLIDADKMAYNYSETKASISQCLKENNGIKEYRISESGGKGPRAGSDIEIRVYGKKNEELNKISNDLMAMLGGISGVTEIETSLANGKSEIRIVPNKEALYINGLTESAVSQLVGTAIYGATISKYRGDGIDEYDIILKADEEKMISFADLNNLKIKNKSGEMIPLNDLCSFEVAEGASQINHYELERLCTITAQCNKYIENGIVKTRVPNEVIKLLKGSPKSGKAGLMDGFELKYPGYTYEFGGMQEQQEETSKSLSKALLVALLLIFTILATQFKSYVKPLIVMAALPFGFIGVVFGLWISNLPFSMMTMISVLALSGIVVNDSLVLVDFINKERDSGMDRWTSLVNAGAIRLRPIIMTTVTTIAGFLPMIISNSVATQDWKPMAVSIAFGLGFATVLTLFLIPVLYSFTDEWAFRKGKKVKAKDVLINK